jgi:hypothetical protein
MRRASCVAAAADADLFGLFALWDERLLLHEGVTTMKRQARMPGCTRKGRTYQPFLESLETRLAPANVDVLSAHNDGFLSGANLQEETLTPANVNAAGFGKLFSQPVDGYVYAQPLYKANLSIAGGTHNVAFVATEHDSVYAFDADSATAGPYGNGLYWKTSFLNPALGVTTVPYWDVGVVGGHTNIVPEIGITGTPVVDGTTNTLYVVAKTKEFRSDGDHYVQKLHALDLTTGLEMSSATIGDTTRGGPDGGFTDMTSLAVPGTGDGSDGTTVRFNALQELQRAALQLIGSGVNGVVYIAWASHEDARPYHGWVAGYSTNNLALVKLFNTAPNTGGVGIWQSGGSLAVDQGKLYFAAGNGLPPDNPNNFNPALGNYAESVLKLDPTQSGQIMPVASYFTPFNWQALDAGDLDLGSGGTMLLPSFVGNPNLLVVMGKSGIIYLLDRGNLGGFTSGGPDNVVQEVSVDPQASGSVYGNPSFLTLNDGSTGAAAGMIYYHGTDDVLKGFYVSNGCIDDEKACTGHPVLTSDPMMTTSGFPGTEPVVSANGVGMNQHAPINGIVWELQEGYDPQADIPNSPSILRAFRATNLDPTDLRLHLLYDSSQANAYPRDQTGGPVKFTVPTVVNGHVLVAGQYTFFVFGLFPLQTTSPAAPTNLQGTAQGGPGGLQVQLSWTNPVPQTGAVPTGITIKRSMDDPLHFAPIASVRADVATYTDTGPLVSGHHYFYQVVAFNQAGTSLPFNTVEIIVAAIPAAVLTIPSFSSSSIGLSWTSVANDHYDVERSADGVNFTVVATVYAAGTTYTDTGLAPGTYTYRIHAYNLNPTSNSLSNTVRRTLLPAGWAARDIGNPGQAGSTSFDGFTWTLQGGGTDIFTPPDQFQYAYQSVSGDTTILAHVSYMQDTNYWAKAGVMFRDGTDPGAPYVALLQNPDNQVEFQWRNHAGDDSSWNGTQVGGTDHVKWMKLVRSVSNNTFAAYYATTDGVPTAADWVSIGSDTLALATPTAGLAVTATDNSKLCTAAFTRVSVTTTPSAPAAPSGLTAVARSSTQINLQWTLNSTNEFGIKVERATDSAFTQNVILLTTTVAGITSYSDTTVIPSTIYFYRVRATNAVGDSANSNSASAMGLPAGWFASDIGVPGQAGSSAFDGTIWTLRGGGTDIFNAPDQFQYAYQSVSGNVTILAHVTFVQNTNYWAKAGIMFRDGTGPGAPYVAVLQNPNNQVEFQWRVLPGIDSDWNGSQVGDTVNVKWVKLVRSGDTFTAYYATTVGVPMDTDWMSIGNHMLAMATPTAGLAVTATDNSKLCTATFAGVSIAGGLAPSPGGGGNPDRTSGSITRTAFGDQAPKAASSPSVIVVSAVIDPSWDAARGTAGWAGNVPAGTTLSVLPRLVDTVGPDDSGSARAPWANGKTTYGPGVRCLQYRLAWTSTDLSLAPFQFETTILWS